MQLARWPGVVAAAAAALVTVFAAQAQTLTTLYRFGGGSGGAIPPSGVIYRHGILYGTTRGGGAPDCDCGIIFALEPTTGNETVLHRFNGEVEGGQPNGLIVAGDTFYATTNAGGYIGGTPDFGTLFEFVPADNTFTVLYGFPGGPHGSFPQTTLTYLDGAFYGTTDGIYANGSVGDSGTAFRFTPGASAPILLHAFHRVEDGAIPTGLNSVGKTQYSPGNLYGASLIGGGKGCLALAGCGTIFRIDPATGAEAVLYRFKNFADGFEPNGLTYVDGFLYGTTLAGGTSMDGTVFKFDPVAGKKTVLYDFKGNGDAESPNAALIYRSGAFYGTSGIYGGGKGCAGNGTNCGTVFKIDRATGAETVLHHFSGLADGGVPRGGLIYHDGAFYGTTPLGGGKGCAPVGCGTVFKLTP